MSLPLVSVIYPVYNDTASDIRRSLTSLIDQEYKNLEIIIIDDSTSEESISAVDSYRFDSRVVVVRENNTSGLAQALNNGIARARGKYIARADADDIQYSDRIKKQVAYLESHPETGILGCNVNYIDTEGNFVKRRTFPEGHREVSRFLHIRNPICHSVVMIRKDVIDRIGPYDPKFKRAEDYELWFRADLNKVGIYNMQETLLDYKMANSVKRDELNWKMNLLLKKKYFSTKYLLSSLMGLASVYAYLYTPKSLQHFIYNKLA